MPASISYRDGRVDHVLTLGEAHVIIGSASTATIRTRDTTVTRRHARIFLDGGRYWVEDLGSDNGTYVNDRRAQRHVLTTGDRLRCGRLELLFAET